MIPIIASTQWPKNLAVTGAILATSIYWLFSGMSFSATRAYMMGFIFLMALFWGRKVFSLRSLSLVFVILLLIDPMALFDIGFQMSFMATMALVVGFEMVPVNAAHWRVWVRWVLGLAFTTMVAAIATAPFGAFHFNVLPKYGLIANMFAVPTMGTAVLPGLALYTFLLPLGWDDWALPFVEWGVAWIVWVADRVAAFPEPVWRVPAAHPLGLFFVLSSYFLYAVFRKLPVLIVVMIVGLIFWGRPDRPDLLIANDARFFGYKEEGERKYSHEKGHSFLAQNWSNRDGHALNQAENHYVIDNNYDVIPLQDGWRIVYSSTKKGLDKIATACQENTIVLAAQAKKPSGACLFLNEDLAQKMGGAMINFVDGQAVMEPIADQRPKPWRENAALKVYSDQSDSDWSVKKPAQ